MTEWDRFRFVMFGLHNVMFTLHIARDLRARDLGTGFDSDTGGPPWSSEPKRSSPAQP